MIAAPTILLRLALAALLGGIIGLERESINRPAGFRTHVLVSVGATLIMLVSTYGFAPQLAEGRFSDPARIAAQVISGIGFLGAGTILKDGNTIRGLTTAASLWVVAGIGLAVGSGFYIGAVGGTILVYITLTLFGKLDERFFHRSQYQVIDIVATDRPGQLGAIGSLLGQRNISIRNVRLERQQDDLNVHIRMFIKLPADVDCSALTAALASIEGVCAVSVPE